MAALSLLEDLQRRESSLKLAAPYSSQLLRFYSYSGFSPACTLSYKVLLNNSSQVLITINTM